MVFLLEKNLEFNALRLRCHLDTLKDFRPKNSATNLVLIGYDVLNEVNLLTSSTGYPETS